MPNRARNSGFTLLEVLIAMSILAVGATSILSIFVAAISFHTKRVEDNRITELLNHAKQHAQVVFNNFDPGAEDKGGPKRPKQIVADLTSEEALISRDRMTREAAEKFAGFKYVITFENNDLTYEGASVVASIKIYRLSGKEDNSIVFDKLFLTRSGTPGHEFFKSPSLETRSTEGKGSARRGG